MICTRYNKLIETKLKQNQGQCVWKPLTESKHCYKW